MSGATLVRLGDLLRFQTGGQKFLICHLFRFHGLLHLIDSRLLLLFRFAVKGRYPQLDQ